MLDEFRDVSLVYAPAADPKTAARLIEHCERLRYRFAVIDCDKAAKVTVEPRSTVTDTQFGAFYFPWITVSDPVLMPASAAMPFILSPRLNPVSFVFATLIGPVVTR